MILDISDEIPDYIEDCEVCCRPIEIRYKVIDGEIISFSANAMAGI